MIQWIKNIFRSKRKQPLYRIYGNRWKIVTRPDGMFDIEDDETFPTLFASDNNGVLLLQAYKLRSIHMNADDGYCYSFHVEINKETDLGVIRP